MTVAATDTVDLFCYSDTDFTTFPQEPIQIMVTPLDSVTAGTLTGSSSKSAPRPAH